MSCIAIIVAGIACDSDDPAEPHGPARIEISGAVSGTDTAMAWLPEPLVVRVFDDGRPRAYATVRIDSSPSESMYVTDDSAQEYPGA